MPTDSSEAPARACNVEVTDDELRVELEDGRTLGVPLAWFPRLFHASPEDRAYREILGAGEGLHWPAVDEDLSIQGLLAGRRPI